MSLTQRPSAQVADVDWWSVRDRALEHVAAEYAATATSLTGGLFRSSARIDDAACLSIELIPDVAHWDYLDVDGDEGVRMIESLLSVASDFTTNLEGPRKKSNGIWEWNWSECGVWLRAFCVAVPDAYDAWCCGGDPEVRVVS